MYLKDLQDLRRHRRGLLSNDINNVFWNPQQATSQPYTCNLLKNPHTHTHKEKQRGGGIEERKKRWAVADRAWVREDVAEAVSELTQNKKGWRKGTSKRGRNTRKGRIEGNTRRWERRRRLHTVSIDDLAASSTAWSKCDNCSQGPSESTSRSSTPGKANVMATHKLKSPRARFTHTPSETQTLHLSEISTCLLRFY